VAEDSALTELTADIVAAFVSGNRLSPSDLPALIQSVSQTLVRVSSGTLAEPTPPPVPAVPIRRSVLPDAIVCLEDGKKFKSLKRHLASKYNLTPQSYRAKWGLPADYPMVAPNYSAARSAMAKSMGLGNKTVAAAAVPAKTPKTAQVKLAKMAPEFEEDPPRTPAEETPTVADAAPPPAPKRPRAKRASKATVAAS